MKEKEEVPLNANHTINTTQPNPVLADHLQPPPPFPHTSPQLTPGAPFPAAQPGSSKPASKPVAVRRASQTQLQQDPMTGQVCIALSFLFPFGLYQELVPSSRSQPLLFSEPRLKTRKKAKSKAKASKASNNKFRKLFKIF